MEEVDGGSGGGPGGEGPFSLDEMDERFGRGFWRASRRFAIWQKGKLRAIDDDAENLGNAATTYWDKLAAQQACFPAQAASEYQEELGEGVRSL